MRLLARALPVFSVATLACSSSGLQPIPESPQINTAALADGAIGLPYSGQLSAAGGNSPYTWSLESVPAELGWLALDPATGALSGTPLAKVSPGVPFFVRVTDSHSRTASRTLTLAVNPCVPGQATDCYRAANGQCVKGSLVCATDGNSGTCGGVPTTDKDHCGGTCGARTTTASLGTTALPR